MARKKTQGAPDEKPRTNGAPRQDQKEIAAEKRSRLADPFTWALVLFPVIGFLLYRGTLESPFIFDDVSNIVTNLKIRIHDISVKALLEAAASKPSSTRFLPNISFALNHYANGLEVRGFHVVNILIHVITSLVLFVFARLTLRTPAVSDESRAAAWVPLAASLLFLVHPLATNVASYIVQRMASMAAMFYLLSFTCYVAARLEENRKRSLPLFALAVLFFGCSLASKQNAATLPVLAALYEWFFFRNLSRDWLLKKLPAAGVVLLILVAAGLYYTNFDPGRILTFPYEFRDFTLSQRLLTQFRVVILYVTLLVLPLPSRMNLDWDFEKSLGVFSPPTTFISILLVCGILIWAVAAARRHRLYSFCVFWFFGNLVIESSFLPLEMVFEHRAYLPSMAFFLAAAFFLLKRVKPLSLAATVLALACALFSAGTINRNRVWADNLTLWRDVVKKSPNKARGHFNLAGVLIARGMPEEALAYCQRGIELDPNSALGYFNLALALENPRIKRYDEALAYYRKALEIKPAYSLALANMAHIMVRKGRAALKNNDRETALADFSQALSLVQSAVDIEPDNPSIWLNAGRSLYMMGNPKASIPYFERALALDPGFAKAHNNIGIAYSDLGDLARASRHLEASLALFPDDSVTMFNLGRMLEKMGQPDRARHYYRKTSQSRPVAPEQMEAVEAARQALALLSAPNPEAKGP